MKNKIYFMAVLLAATMPLCLVSCSGPGGAVIGGEQISPELLYSLAGEQWENDLSVSFSVVPGTTVTVSVTQPTKVPEASDIPFVTSASSGSLEVTPEPESSAMPVENTTVTQPNVVYWSNSGSVYHVKPNCSALSHAKQVHTGSLEEAIQSKKLQKCSKCSKDSTTITSAETTEDPKESIIPDNIAKADVETVFWTENGTVYHLRKTCPALVHASEIFSGTVKEALDCNKEKLCARCAQK